MARPLRIEYPGALYHVMNRGTDRCPIFLDEVGDRNLFKGVIARAIGQYKIIIHAYSLMGNHYHLLIETPLPNLHKAMRHLDGVYTQWFNKKHSRDGALFRGRYKSILVQRETYFLELVRYIHLNGTKALLFPNPTADRWGSHRCYMFPKIKPQWLTTDTALSYFQESKKPLIAFDQFVRKGVSKTCEEKLGRRRWPAILGVKTFIEEIRKKCIVGTAENRHQPQRREIIKENSMKVSEIRCILNKFFGSQAFLSNGEMTKEYKWTFIYMLRTAGQLTFEEIGREVGGVTYSGVIRYYQRHNFEKSEIFQTILSTVSHVKT